MQYNARRVQRGSELVERDRSPEAHDRSGSSPPALWRLVGGLRDEASAADAGKRIHFGNVSTMKQGSQLFGLFLRQADPNWIPFWFFLSCGRRRHHGHAPFYTPTKFFVVRFLTRCRS
jgi:hypothetical protein